MKRTRLVTALIILIAIGLVAAVTIYSATLSRTQEIFESGHEISIDPDPFPDLISSCGSANLIITESDTTTGRWATGPCTCTWIRVDAISPSGSWECTFTLDYEGFVGTASYDVRAEGTTYTITGPPSLPLQGD